MAEYRNWIARMGLRDEWLNQVQEEITDPEREIVDPHHHFWNRGGSIYQLEELWNDTSSGHNIVQTVFIECRSRYKEDGPEYFKSVGETEFAVELAQLAAKDMNKAQVAGIIAHADLRNPQIEDVLDAHEAAGKGLLRGIRQAGSRDDFPNELSIPGLGPQGLYDNDNFRAGVARLGECSLTYDTWHYHHQNQDFRNLAEAVPGTTLVLDHFGTPLGVGRFAGKRDEIFAAWKDDIAAIAEQPNVIAKLGGLAMVDNGWGWHTRDLPPTSDEFVETQGEWYRHMISCFGPDRCMFESNFPVDRASISYHVLWNAFKKIAMDYSDAAQTAMFSGAARQVYKL